MAENNAPPSDETQMATFITNATTDGEILNDEQPAEETRAPAEAESAEAETEKPAKLVNLSKLIDPSAPDETEVEETEAEETETEETEAEKTEKKPPEPASKPKNSAQERINKAVAAQRAAERRTAEMEARLAALEQNRAAPLTTQSPNANTSTTSDSAPDPSEFEYGELDGRYIAALARFETRQELRLENERVSRQRQQSEALAAQNAHAERVSSFAEKSAERYPDFNETVLDSAKAGEWSLSPTVGELMLSSPYGADIAYHLATHPVDAEKLAKKSPAEQGATFGRMEAMFEASAASQAVEKTAPKATKAPPPVKVPRGTAGKYAISAATPSFADFEKMAMGRG